jgi:hypothetical protein
MLRVSATVTFSTAIGRNIRPGKTFTDNVDTSFSGNVGQLRQRVLESIIKAISQKYELRKALSADNFSLSINGIISI